jgi:hypothetical protein
MGKLFIIAILLASVAVSAQDKPVKVFLTPDSTNSATSVVPLGQVAQAFERKECSGITLTRDNSKADYVLDIGANGLLSSPHWRYVATLLSPSGDILFHTQTTRFESSMKDVCNYIRIGKK